MNTGERARAPAPKIRSMVWKQAMAAVSTLRRTGREDIGVRGVQYDSRRVAAGEIFVAMAGGSTDGNRFIDAALRRGAAALVTDSPEIFRQLQEQQPELALALVEHGRRALAEISSALFGRPQDQLALTAITGTNGKTTTAFLIEQLLRSVGRSSVLLGTIETRVGDSTRLSEHTTPESRDILALFAEAVRAGCTEAVMEMSSHALEQERVWGIPVDVAVFTNLTQDHLDYHGSMEKYAAAKARLFTGVGTPPPRVAIINIDDAYAGAMREVAIQGSAVFTYAIEQGTASEADFMASDVALSAGRTTFWLRSPFGEAEVHSQLCGRVNVYNLLAAMAAAIARGLTLEQAVISAAGLRPAPGRFETVANTLGITVVVDYAHTEDALMNLLGLARELVGASRVITLFGCGGDRDRTKRPKMGRAAAAESDLVVITSDNPRSEDPMAIIDEVLLGVRETHTTFVVEEDRRAAIEVALRSARTGDIVLLAGKGHEKTQILDDGAAPFDDIGEAARILRTLEAETIP